jgi:hypothetical protein
MVSVPIPVVLLLIVALVIMVMTMVLSFLLSVVMTRVLAAFGINHFIIICGTAIPSKILLRIIVHMPSTLKGCT